MLERDAHGEGRPKGAIRVGLLEDLLFVVCSRRVPLQQDVGVAVNQAWRHPVPGEIHDFGVVRHRVDYRLDAPVLHEQDDVLAYLLLSNVEQVSDTYRGALTRQGGVCRGQDEYENRREGSIGSK